MDEPQHLFEMLTDFATARGAKNIKALPGCWEHAWEHGGNKWLVAVHAGPGKRKTSQGDAIDPFVYFIACNGWPAAIVDMAGWTVAAGSVINEAALRAALEEAP